MQVPGWELALPRMRVGETARLLCEARYAFGEAGYPPHVPASATVHFDLELLATRDLLESNNTETVRPGAPSDPRALQGHLSLVQKALVQKALVQKALVQKALV